MLLRQVAALPAGGARGAGAGRAAGALAVASALIRQTYPTKQLGRGLGINSVIVSSSAAAAPTIGGLVLSVAPWPWVFASAIPFAIFSLLLGRALPDPAPRDKKFDSAPGVVRDVRGDLRPGHRRRGRPRCMATVRWCRPRSCWWGCWSAPSSCGGVHVALGPILPVDLLARPAIALSAVGAYTAFIASMTLLLSTPFRLTHQFGWSAAEVGGRRSRPGRSPT
ncbi:MFS transporter [Sphingomonas sp. MMS24-JH45]